MKEGSWQLLNYPNFQIKRKKEKSKIFKVSATYDKISKCNGKSGLK